MGKGDRRTRKGKINIRSYGNKRPHAEAKAVVTKTTVPAKTTVAKKAAPAPARKKA